MPRVLLTCSRKGAASRTTATTSIISWLSLQWSTMISRDTSSFCISQTSELNEDVERHLPCIPQDFCGDVDLCNSPYRTSRLVRGQGMELWEESQLGELPSYRYSLCSIAVGIYVGFWQFLDSSILTTHSVTGKQITRQIHWIHCQVDMDKDSISHLTSISFHW